jgi:small conductance mechanosensitive channel
MPFVRLIALALACLFAPAPAPAQILPGAPPEAAEAPAAEAPDAAAALRALARVLEDPAQREALLRELNAAAGVAAEPEAEAPASFDASIARAIADRTLDAAEGVSTGLLAAADALGDVDGLVDAARRFDLRGALDELFAVAATIAVTIGLFWALRRLTMPLRRRIAGEATDRGPLSKLMGLVGVALLEATVIALSWGAGYAFALYIGGGAMDLRQSLFLNAFLVIETTKLVLRLLLAPRRPALRLPPISDAAATAWYAGPARIAAVLGYGVLLAAPIAAETVSPELGWVVRQAAVLLAAWMAVRLVLRSETAVRAGLEARVARMPDGVLSHALAALARVWHLLAIAYVVAVLFIWTTRPADSLAYVVRSTALSALAIALGMVAMVAISRAIAGGVKLSEPVNTRLPMLERRLNAFVPNILAALRILVALGILAAIGQAWGLFDTGAWLSSDAGRALVASLLSAAMILLVAGLVWLAVSSWIEYKLNPSGTRTVSAREKTLLALLRNAFTVLVVVMTAMLTLSALGVNIAPLLAGAGVVGLAIGFGAQKLVQDIITGAFIQFENAMNTGDVVTAGGVTGVVERLTIRSVGLRALDGTYHLIPFSSVDTVSNLMKDFSYHVAEIGVAYREDIGQVKALMQNAFERLKAGEHGPAIIGALDMQGVIAFADSAVILRARIMTRPGQQWALGRAYNEILKEVFDAAGIEIPFPHLTIYLGEDKEGKAPPLRLRPERAEIAAEPVRGLVRAPG